MRDVFISYRRSDSAGHTGRLLDALEKRFDAEKFFRDIEDLKPGVDFPDALSDALAQCKAMLVVIGPSWASVATEAGPRIRQAEDFVRIEVAAGLARSGVLVIPVLVGGALLPKASELPPELQDLTRRNEIELSDKRWEFDVQRLADALGGKVRRNLWSSRSAVAAAVAVAVSAAAFGAYKLSDLFDDDPLAVAEKELKIAEANARTAKANADRAEDEARKRAIDAANAKSDADQATATAVATKQAVEKVEAELLTNVYASPDQKAAADAQAARLAQENEAAQRVAAAKAAEADAARQREEKAQAEATTLKVQQYDQAATAARTADVAQVAAKVAAKAATEGGGTKKASADAGAAPLSFPRWTLSSGGCGAGPLSVSGMATFTIDKTAAGIVVTENFRGQGGGFEVVVSGSATFQKEARSYDIPTTGQWSGSRVFKSAGIDRVNTSDGITPRTANVVKIQSLCG